MARGQRAILSGGGRWRFEVANLREWSSAWKASVEALAEHNSEGHAAAKVALYDAFKEAAELIRDLARSKLTAVGGPRRLQGAAFAFTDLTRSPIRKNQRSTLAGVRTGAKQKDERIFFTWGKSGINRRKGGTFAAKGLSMSLARIVDKGTRFIKPKRFFKDTLFSSKSKVLAIITNGYKRAVSILHGKR